MATARDASAVQSRRTRKLRHGPVTREQILDASLKLFSDKGFARTSVRDIAQAAGITDAAIYYHFASKRDLFEALIEERGFTAALQSLETVEIVVSDGAHAHGDHDPDTLPARITVGPREAIPAMAEGALQFIYRNRDLMKVLMVEALADDPVATDEYKILVERWKKAEARIMRQYAELGLLRTEAVDELAAQLVITVIGVFADHMMMPSRAAAGDEVPEELTRHVEVAMQHIVQGITSPGP